MGVCSHISESPPRTERPRRLPRRLLVWTGLLVALVGRTAGAAEVIVVRTSDLAPYKAVEAAFVAELGRPVHGLNLATDKDALGTMLKQPGDVVFAIGPEAARAVAEAHTGLTPLYALVLSPEKLGADARAHSVPMYVRPARLAKGIKTLLPSAKVAGIVYNPAQSQALVDECEKAAAAVGMKLLRQEVSSKADVAGAVRGMVGKADVLWLVPDATAIGVDTVKFMVQLSMENRLPIVGYSQGLTRAGAVLSIEAEYDEMGRNAAKTAKQLLGGKPASPETPSGNVYLNAKSAQLLGVAIPDAIRQEAKLVIE